MKVIFKFIQCVLLLLLISMTLAACGGGGDGSISFLGASSGSGSNTEQPVSAPSPEASAEQAISSTSGALKSNDTQKAVESFIPSDQPRMKKAFDSLSQNGRNNLADALSRATIVETTDDKIVYKTTMDDGEGNQVEVNFTLFKQDGVWKFLYL